MHTIRAITLSVALGLMTFAPTASLAKHGADDVAGGGSGGGKNAKSVAGSCTGRATTKLKVKPDNGRLQTEFEVDQNRNGVTWKVTIRRNGKVAVGTSRTTRAPSGSFSVHRRLTDGAGSDRISARATSPSGQVCKAAVTV